MFSREEIELTLLLGTSEQKCRLVPFLSEDERIGLLKQELDLNLRRRYLEPDPHSNSHHSSSFNPFSKVLYLSLAKEKRQQYAYLMSNHLEQLASRLSQETKQLVSKSWNLSSTQEVNALGASLFFTTLALTTASRSAQKRLLFALLRVIVNLPQVPAQFIAYGNLSTCDGLIAYAGNHFDPVLKFKVLKMMVKTFNPHLSPAKRLLTGPQRLQLLYIALLFPQHPQEPLELTSIQESWIVVNLIIPLRQNFDNSEIDAAVMTLRSTGHWLYRLWHTS